MKIKQLYFLIMTIVISFTLTGCKKDKSTLSTVRTFVPLYVASNTTVVGCIVESDGGSAIVDCGIYFGTSQTPETSGSRWQMGNDTGSYYGRVTGLLANTQYYVKAYAKNVKGESLGDLVNFTTPPAVTDYDNNTYETVVISSQSWMTRNLKTTHYMNGDAINTTNPSSLDITAETSPKYQWAYSGSDANVLVYGRLYTWFAVTDSRKVCPTGWHVPNDAEWSTLATNLEGYGYPGSELKENGNDHWLSPYNTDANNITCFSALPGGYRSSSGSFYLLQNDGYWWSSTESESLSAWARILDTQSTAIGRSGINKRWGISVRCIKD